MPLQGMDHSSILCGSTNLALFYNIKRFLVFFLTFDVICVIIEKEQYGRLAERPIALAWKAGIQKCITGSNPVPSAIFSGDSDDCISTE